MNIFNLDIATMDAQKRTELLNPYTELTTTNAKVRSLECYVSRVSEAEATRQTVFSSAPSTPLRLPMLLRIYRYRLTLRECMLHASKGGRSF